MKVGSVATETTKRKILDAFWILFRQQSIEKITIDALSKQAGIHRSSFYRYFLDIYQVLEVFQEELLTHIKTEVESIQATTDITLPAYTEKISVLMVSSADKIYRLLNCRHSDFEQSFVNVLRPNVEKYFPQNEHLEYISSFIISSMLFNFNFWYEHREQYEFREVTELGKNIVLHGIFRAIKI